MLRKTLPSQEFSMDMSYRIGLLAFVAVTAATPLAAQSTDAATKPAQPQAPAKPGASASYTPEQVAKGDALFHGSANCYACHGSKGEGLVGPNLTDAEWIHSKGTYDEIVKQINHGVPKEESKSGIVMPPKGGADLSDDDVKAVAAYVYSLSHK
jgi:mono/diheme cytochrome c family protein